MGTGFFLPHFSVVCWLCWPVEFYVSNVVARCPKCDADKDKELVQSTCGQCAEGALRYFCAQCEKFIESRSCATCQKREQVNLQEVPKKRKNWLFVLIVTLGLAFAFIYLFIDKDKSASIPERKHQPVTSVREQLSCLTVTSECGVTDSLFSSQLVSNIDTAACEEAGGQIFPDLKSAEAEKDRLKDAYTKECKPFAKAEKEAQKIRETHAENKRKAEQ